MTQHARQQRFEIAAGFSDTAQFLGDVRVAADSDKNALGFFPESLIEEFARQDGLYVLVEKAADGRRYAGHLLFDLRFPRAHVRQMFIASPYRRDGLASFLVDHLKTALTSLGFIAIYARVADDLIAANQFWDHQHFYVQRVEDGGSSRRRKIIVRSHELTSPQLFPTSGITANNPLGLASASANRIPLYLLDLNVLFDLGPRRFRHKQAMSLFQADRMNVCKVAISDEIREELLRTAAEGKTDPMQSYIRIFPSFPLMRDGRGTSLLDELAGVLFPEKHSRDQLSPNDMSDVCHVATVIQHDLSGLITSDQTLLKAAPIIKARYGIGIISPKAFSLDSQPSKTSGSFEAAEDTTLHLQVAANNDQIAVLSLLERVGLTASEIASGWAVSVAPGNIGTDFVVFSGDTVVGFSKWLATTPSGAVTARIAVDEAVAESAAAARALLINLLGNISQSGPLKIQLEVPLHQSVVREVAADFGFHGGDGKWLVKLSLGRILRASDWSGCQQELAEKFSVRLPAEAPFPKSVDHHLQVLTPDGNRSHVTLDALESLLSPALYCFPGRPAVITPVQRKYSEFLIGHSAQRSLLPHGTAALHSRRHYLSDSRNLPHFKRGTLMLFYESTRNGGRAGVVAIARVRQAYRKPVAVLDESDLEQSVLTRKNIDGIGAAAVKTVTVFDNVFPFPRVVPLEFLRRIGCGKPTDLITTHSITDDQLQAILEESFRG